MALYQIKTRWKDIVGPQIALHTSPERLHTHTLSLWVDSAPWMNQLLFFKKEIAEKTNRFLALHDFKKHLIENVYLKIAPLHSLFPPKGLGGPSPAIRRQATSESNRIGRKSTPMSKEAAALKEEINALSDEALKETVWEALSGYFQEEPTGFRIQKEEGVD